jgi:hypothetical protein
MNKKKWRAKGMRYNEQVMAVSAAAAAAGAESEMESKMSTS